MSQKTTIQLWIDEDFLNSVPRPTTEQYEALKESIRKNGLLQPIHVTKDGKILDGHTRYDICQELDISPKFVIKDIPEENQKTYAVTVNLKRRHLTDFQIVELLESDLYNIKAEARAVGYSELEGRNKKKSLKRGNLPREQRSPFYEISKTIGVNPIRIEKILRIKENASPSTIQQVKEGEISVERAIKTIEKKKSQDPRYNYKKKLLPKPKVFKFCPICGTETLESWYDVVEIHCTKCDYYYSIKRRKH